MNAAQVYQPVKSGITIYFIAEIKTTNVRKSTGFLSNSTLWLTLALFQRHTAVSVQINCRYFCQMHAKAQIYDVNFTMFLRNCTSDHLSCGALTDVLQRFGNV